MRITSKCTSRTIFYSEIRNILGLINEPLLTDVCPPSDKHNVSSRILRRGLSIVTFSLLEGYLEERLDELYYAMSGSRILFADFNEDLRNFVAVDAIVGLANRLSFEQKSDRQAIAEKSIRKIVGFSATPPTYTAIGFSPKGSNVSKEDVSAALKAFGIKGGWAKLANVAALIGSARLSLDSEYDAVSKLRHKAAHDPATNVPSGDLKAHLETIILVGITFDILSTILVAEYLRNKDPAKLQSAIGNPKCIVRFLDERLDGKWTERLDSSRKPTKLYKSEDDARAGALTRSDDRFVIVRDARLVPLELV